MVFSKPNSLRTMDYMDSDNIGMFTAGLYPDVAPKNMRLSLTPPLTTNSFLQHVIVP